MSLKTILDSWLKQSQTAPNDEVPEIQTSNQVVENYIKKHTAFFGEDKMPAGFLVGRTDDGSIVSAGGFLQRELEQGNISRLSDISIQFPYAEARQIICYNTAFYDVDLKRFELKDQEFCTVVLTEHSEQHTPQTAIGLIIIDNYDEAVGSTEEARRPILTAIIDRKLNEMAHQVGGIIKKFERDRFLFIFSYERLEALKSKKFDILKQVRDTDVGNSIPPTLSIGIGVGEALDINLGYAQAAVDLALGRGGDQAIIKDAEKYYFFGAQSREHTSTGRVRARVKADAFAGLIERASNVIVLGHRNIDLDCIGAGIGVYKIVSALERECHIVLGEVTTSIRALYERLMEDETYREGVFISAEAAAAKIDDSTLLVIVDTHRPSLVEGGELLSHVSARNIIVFDHHRKAAEFIESPVLTYHEPFASSACELISELIQYTNAKIKLKQVEADALLAGIMVDTKGFVVKTGSKTFEVAAYLRRNGADNTRVKLLLKNDWSSFKAKAEAVANTELYNNGVAIAISPANVENPTLTAAQTADELLNIAGVKASFVMCETGDIVHISGRSLGDVNVQMILEAFGGGGHLSSAGAQVACCMMEDVKQRLKEEIDDYFAGDYEETR